MQSIVGEDPGPGLRERKKRARREALIGAAQHLVGERGLHGVTVEDICDEVGVSPRTFFNYFETKDDAVLGLGPWEPDEDAVATYVTGGPTGREADDLAHLVAALVARAPVSRDRLVCAMELARREPELLVRQAAAMHRHHAHVSDAVSRRLGLEAGSPRVELVTMIALGLTRATYVRWEAGDRTDEPADAVRLVMAELRTLLAD